MADWTPPTLAGELAVLVPLALKHAASLRRHADDEEVWKTLFEGFPRPYTLADAEGWCNGGWRAAGVVWGISVHDEVIGCVGVRQDQGWLRCNAEVGYWVGRSHWGKGIATEALRLASGWALSQVSELTRLYAPIFDWNAASQAVAVKAGYALEGRMPLSAMKAGRVIGRVVYAQYRVT
jgi:[ribosomal protein S5]-alanine N-acetyltransferase